MESRLPVLSYDDGPEEPAVGPASGSVGRSSSTCTAAPAARDTAANSRPALQNHAGSPPKAAPVTTSGTARSTGSKSTSSCKNSSSSSSSSANMAAQQEPHDAAMQELSRERRRRAFIGMLKLLEHGAANDTQLQQLVAPMSDEELLQVAEERSLAGKCGNPLCSKPFSWQEPRVKYRATADNIHKVEGDCYCSRACASFMQQLAAQLLDPMARLQPDALQAYLARPSHRPQQQQQQQQGVAAQGGGVETMKSVVEERDPFQLIHEAEEAGRQLQQAAAAASGNATAAATVEGYVPRKTPNKQPRQQQQQDAGDDAEPMEVLQLQPAIRKSAAAGVATAEASSGAPQAEPASSSSSSSNVDSMDSMLQAFRQHRDKQLHQIQQQHGQPVDVTGAGPPAAAAGAAGVADVAGSNTDTAAVAASGVAAGTANQQSTQQAVADTAEASSEPTAAAADQEQEQPPRRRRTVTFAPDVAYSCPAEPQAPPEQPMLTFTLHDAGSPLELGSSGSSNGLVGELQLTSAEDLEGLDPDLAAAAAAGVDDDDDAAAAAAAAAAAGGNGELPPMPEVWKLFLPPALGGVGVPVKQLVKTRPLPKQQHRSSDPSSGLSSSSSRSSAENGRGLAATQRLPSTTAAAGAATRARQPHQQQIKQRLQPPSSSMAAAGMVFDKGAGPAAGTTSFKVAAALKQGMPAAAQPVAAGTSTAAANSNSSSIGMSSSSQVDSSPAAAGGAGAAKARKFVPTVRPRRSVVVLDASEVPGVTVWQRGVARPGGSSSITPAAAAAASAASAGQQAVSQVCSLSAPNVQEASSAALSDGVGCAAANGARSKIAVVHSSSSSDEESESDPEQEDSNASQQDCFPAGHAARGIGSSNTAATKPAAGQRTQCTPAVTAATVRASANRAIRSSCSHVSSDSDSSSSSEEDDEARDNFLQGDGDDDDGLSEADGPWRDGGSEDEEGLGLEGGLAGALQAVLPFLDTKGVTVHLSEFGLMWNTLHGWISPATVAYVSNIQQQQQEQPSGLDSAGTSRIDEQQQQEQRAGEDEQGAQEHVHVPPLAVVQQRTALANLLGQALPLVTQQLGIQAPLPEISRHLHALVRSFYMPGPLPALQAHQWQLLAALLLAALSAWRLPSLRPLFVRGQVPGSKLGLMLRGVGCDVDRFMALLDLFELHV